MLILKLRINGFLIQMEKNCVLEEIEMLILTYQIKFEINHKSLIKGYQAIRVDILKMNFLDIF